MSHPLIHNISVKEASEFGLKTFAKVLIGSWLPQQAHTQQIQYIITCALLLKKLWDSDMLYRICVEYCVPILSHFWRKLVCWELFKVLGISHCPVGSTRQWLLPKTLNSSQQTNFRQKWLKIGTQYSKHILYNISESHNFIKKSAHVSL